MLSGHQLAHGLKNGELTFVTSLLENQDEDLVDEMQSIVSDVLKEFSNVMLRELPCEIPPRRVINH